MATAFSYAATLRVAEYPDAYRQEIEAVMRQWRSEFWARAMAEEASS